MNPIYFSAGSAVFLTLLAAAMWGSWMQIVKHLGDYPVSGLSLFLYTFAFIFVWGLTFALSALLIPEGIKEAVKANLNIIPKILIGGGMMSLGMAVSLEVLGRIGLLLSATLSGAFGSILGIITSIAEEGIPETPGALTLVIIITFVFILAGFVCSLASIMRDHDRTEDKVKVNKSVKSQVSVSVVLLSALGTFLMNGWSIGTAAGTAGGVPPILTAALMVTGSFLGIALFCGIKHTVRQEWKTVLCIGRPKKPFVFSLIAAFCHYGGNILSIYSMPALSATLSFLFGRTLNIWTYFWGFYYKEFSGSKKRTYAVLFSGIALFFLGLGLLGLFSYGG